MKRSLLRLVAVACVVAGAMLMGGTGAVAAAKPGNNGNGNGNSQSDGNGGNAKKNPSGGNGNGNGNSGGNGNAKKNPSGGNGNGNGNSGANGNGNGNNSSGDDTNPSDNGAGANDTASVGPPVSSPLTSLPPELPTTSSSSSSNGTNGLLTVPSPSGSQGIPVTVPADLVPTGMDVDVSPSPQFHRVALDQQQQPNPPQNGDVSPMSDPVAFRAGYSDYLRNAGTAQITAIAVPGAAAILLFAVGGGFIGYRQARAGYVIRAEGIARFLR